MWYPRHYRDIFEHEQFGESCGIHITRSKELIPKLSILLSAPNNWIKAWNTSLRVYRILKALVAWLLHAGHIWRCHTRVLYECKMKFFSSWCTDVIQGASAGHRHRPYTKLSRVEIHHILWYVFSTLHNLVYDLLTNVCTLFLRTWPGMYSMYFPR